MFLWKEEWGDELKGCKIQESGGVEDKIHPFSTFPRSSFFMGPFGMSTICQKEVLLDSNCCLFWVKKCEVSASFLPVSLLVIKSNMRLFSKRAITLPSLRAVCKAQLWDCSLTPSEGILILFFSFVKRWRVVDTSGTHVTSMSLRACQRCWDGILLKVGHQRCIFTTISHEWISLECIIWCLKGNTDCDVCLKMFYLGQSD